MEGLFMRKVKTTLTILVAMMILAYGSDTAYD